MKNKAALEKIGGPRTDIVMTDRWLARLFMQVSQQVGLGDIINKTLSFHGSSMFIVPVPPQLAGHKFADVAWHYPNAVPLGTITAKHVATLAHVEDRVLQNGEDLIMLSNSKVEASQCQVERFCTAPHIEGRTHSLSPRQFGVEPEIIIVVGWGDLIGPFLVQVDLEVHPGTRVITVSPTPLEEIKEHLGRVQRRWEHKFTNATLEHVTGMLGSPTVWDRLPVPLEQASRIFILADQSAEDLRHADACTIAAVIQVRHLLSEKNIKKHIPIIPEIKDPRTEHLCRICNISSYVDSSGMPVQVLAAVSVEPRLRLALRNLVGDDGEVSYGIRGIQDYLPEWKEPPESISFMQAQGLVNQAGDVLIGWSWDAEPEMDKEFSAAMVEIHGEMKSVTWDLNPKDKSVMRPWKRSDRIAIIGYH